MTAGTIAAVIMAVVIMGVVMAQVGMEEIEDMAIIMEVATE